MICKICGVDKVREMQLKNGSYIYVSDNKRWNGKVCPVCLPKDKKRRRGHIDVIKSCSWCEKEFKTAKKRQVVCSKKCRDIRRSKNRRKRVG